MFDYWSSMFGSMSEAEVAEAAGLRADTTRADAEAAVETVLDKAEIEAQAQALTLGDDAEMARGRETARREILAAWGRRPVERFGLREVHRMTVGGDLWVLYGDGEHLDLCPAEQFDRPTTTEGYSEWCSGTSSGSEEIMVRMLRDLGGPTQTANSGAHGGVSANMFISGDYVVAGEGKDLDYGRIDREGGYVVAWLDSLVRSPVLSFRQLQKELAGARRFGTQAEAEEAFKEAFDDHANDMWVAEDEARVEGR